MFIRLRGQPMFDFAGLDTVARDDGSGADLASCAIVTCAPNELMADIHNRMPAILDTDAVDRWLDPGVKDTGAVLPLLRAYSADAMEAYTVEPLAPSVRNEGPELIRSLIAA
jgi:putative SOS response-associated peptidase YedK